MNCKLEMPNGVKIECNEGVEKLFDLYKSLNDSGLIDKKTNTLPNNIDKNYIQSELDKCIERCQRLTNENALLKGENENLTTQLLGIQNDTTDLDFLNGEVERLEKVESELKIKLQKQKEDYENKILELENKLKSIDIVSEGTSQDKVIIPKVPTNNEIKNVIPQIPKPNKIEIPSNNQEDFNPNNAQDLAWLKEQLGSGKKEEDVNIPEPNKDTREMVDGYYVERNTQGQIVKIDDIQLEVSEIMGLQYKITTVKKIMDSRKMMSENDKVIASGWEE